MRFTFSKHAPQNTRTSHANTLTHKHTRPQTHAPPNSRTPKHSHPQTHAPPQKTLLLFIGLFAGVDLLGSHLRKEQYILNRDAISHEHSQAVDANTHT